MLFSAANNGLQITGAAAAVAHIEMKFLRFTKMSAPLVRKHGGRALCNRSLSWTPGCKRLAKASDLRAGENLDASYSATHR
jgi:hypothetical protein